MRNNNNELVKRYSKALFDLALEQDKIDKIKEDLQAVRDVVNKNPGFLETISAPTINKHKAQIIVKEIFAKFKISLITKNFLSVVAIHGRMIILHEIIEEYNNRVSLHLGELTAEIVSAIALDKKQTEAIALSLENSLNKKIRIKQTVNSKILGGLIVKLGSTMIDNSLASKLDRIKKISKDAILGV
jgi:F-type H+-transporting ATPase subunit delta